MTKATELRAKDVAALDKTRRDIARAKTILAQKKKEATK
jgi:ribosomal protein L29